MAESVTKKNITQEDIDEAEVLEEDTKKLLRLIDLIFLSQDENKLIYS